MCCVAPKATEMLDLKVNRILGALKVIVNSHCCKDSDKSESHGYRVKKVFDQPEKQIVNVTNLNFSQLAK